MTHQPWSFGIALLCSASLFGCGGGGEDDAAVVFPDSGIRRDAGLDSGSTPPTPDSGPMPDAGDMTDSGPTGVDCGAGSCSEFQYCDDGTCRDYPACRGDGTCDRPGDSCHNRRCVPNEVDIDGDGYSAGEDCDETNPDINPGEEEFCNDVDEDCDDLVDEGDPAMLCEFYPGGGICDSGTCGCPAGTFDLDRSVPGCECIAAPAIDTGLSCVTAIDLGDIPDDGTMQTLTGNVMPDDREVWYRFNGTDSVDTSCDNYHVRVQFTSNPDDAFEFTVFRGSCDTASCEDSGFTDFNWATDLRATIDSRLTGQCPCVAASAGEPGVNQSVCTDDSSEYFVRVRRRAGSTLSCENYSIEVSNGLYDTP